MPGQAQFDSCLGLITPILFIQSTTYINNLAKLYSKQGKYDAAEPLCMECAEKAKATLGSDHPDTLRFLKNRSIAQKNLNKLCYMLNHSNLKMLCKLVVRVCVLHSNDAYRITHTWCIPLIRKCCVI
jgi:hypothetical protein